MYELIVKTMQEVAEMQGKKLATAVTVDSVLLDIGLDSLSYAILVVELETKIGFDPFQMESAPIYPVTMREFVALYEKHYEAQ